MSSGQPSMAANAARPHGTSCGTWWWRIRARGGGVGARPAHPSPALAPASRKVVVRMCLGLLCTGARPEQRYCTRRPRDRELPLATRRCVTRGRPITYRPATVHHHRYLYLLFAWNLTWNQKLKTNCCFVEIRFQKSMHYWSWPDHCRFVTPITNGLWTGSTKAVVMWRPKHCGFYRF